MQVQEEHYSENTRPIDAPADARTPTDDVLDVLRSSRRLTVDDLDTRFAVENAVQSVGGWSQCDPLAAAHEAVTLAADPTWNLTSVGRLMLLVLRKQREQLKPSSRGQQESPEDRRARLHAEADRLEAEEAARS